MNYLNVYQKLIDHARVITNSNEYVEKHHVLPRCMGGTDDKENLVLLTPRQHYIAHRLLARIYPNNYKLTYALLCMMRDPHTFRRYNSHTYDTVKRLYAKMQSKRFTENNPMWTQEAKQFHSNRMKGDNNPMRRFPERNRTAYPVVVVFDDGSQVEFQYGKQAYESLNIPRSTWIHANRLGIGIPKYKITKISKKV